jgi:hypothetical protein
MFGVLIATVIAVAAIVWIVMYVVRQQVVEREQVSEELHAPQTPTLEYAVPTGQDPTVLIAALEKAGYTATANPHHAHQRLLVACPDGLDREREHVREVIASASVTAPSDGVPLEPDVRFRDET